DSILTARCSMNRRTVQSLGASLIGGILLMAVASVGAQTPAAKPAATPAVAAQAKPPANWKAPRTPWGDPDLQGTWNNGTITPLERPRTAGEKELLSKEEEEEINAQSDTRAEQRPANRA